MSDLLNRQGASSDTLDEKARRAVDAFRALQPILTTYAQMRTGNKNVRVDLSPTDNGSTNGQRIFYRPPIELGDNTQHIRSLCDRRNSDGLQKCPACAIRESILVTIYHEIGHICEDTFAKPSDRDKRSAIEFAIREAKGQWANEVAERIRNAPSHKLQDYANLTNLINGYLQFLWNAMEDVRVNSKTFLAQPGVQRMFDADTSKIFREGFEAADGQGGTKIVRWQEAPLNSQVMIGVFCKASGYNYRDWFHPKVVDALDDNELTWILSEMSRVKSAGEVYNLSFKVLARLRDLGFCGTPQDPDPEPEPEPEEQDEETDDDVSEEPEEGDSESEESEADDSSDSGDSSSMGESSPDEDDGEESGDSDLDDDDSGDSSSGGGNEEGDGQNDGEEEVDESSPSDADSDMDAPSPDGSSDSGSGDADRTDEQGEAQSPTQSQASESTPENEAESDHQPQPASAESDDDEVDTGADDGYGGTDLLGDLPEMGTPDDLESVMDKWLQHEEKPNTLEVKEAEDAIDKAIVQGLYFNKPSENIYGVREHDYDHQNEFSNAWIRPAYTNLDIPESMLQPSLLRLRRVFTDNKRGKRTPNKKSGSVNASVLGRRAWSGDPRLFSKVRQPGKKDYFVVIGVDISGSTQGVNLKIEKQVVFAQCELLDRLGIPFVVVAHTGNQHSSDRRRDGLDLEIYWIKRANEPWNKKTIQRLEDIGHSAYNLDGHALEFLRKIADTSRATDKIILYYSDGKMPSTNKEEELHILQSEIATCAAKRYTLLGVGIRTDSPKAHGLDTVEAHSNADLEKVVKHLEKRLSGAI